MSNTLTVILVAAFAFTCFGISVVFMPWSELGMPQWAEPLLPVKQAMTDMLPGSKDPVLKERYQASSPDTPFDTYVYSAFLSAAMVAAAIAINIVGRQDAEEKTILPVKK